VIEIAYTKISLYNSCAAHIRIGCNIMRIPNQSYILNTIYIYTEYTCLHVTYIYSIYDHVGEENKRGHTKCSHIDIFKFRGNRINAFLEY
jgi:hypothetical protein